MVVASSDLGDESHHRSSLLTGHSADAALRQLVGFEGSRTLVWQPTLLAMLRAVSRFGELAIPSSSGTVAFHEGTQELRACLHGHGWRTPAELQKDGALGRWFVPEVPVAWVDQAGLMIAPDHRSGISLAAADRPTGVATGRAPQVRTPKGYAIRFSVVQLPLFGPAPADAPIDWWFLVHDVRDDGFRAELSLPRSLGHDGLVTSWSRRIALTGGDGFTPGSSGLPPAGPVPSTQLPPVRVKPKRSS